MEKNLMLIKDSMSEKERFDFFYKEMSKSGKIMYAGKILQKAYNNFPNNVALIYKEKEITYTQLYSRTCSFAKKLKEQGVGPEDIVLIFFRNSLEFYIAYFATWQTGAVVAPLNIYLKEYELKHILKDSKAKLAIVDEKKQGLFKDFEIPILTQQDMDLGSEVLEEIREFKIREFEIPDKDPEKMAALLYTSGTTGLPKGVMLSSKNIITNMAQALSIMPFSESKKIYCILPLFHCFAQNCCVWTSIFSGSTIIVVPKISRGEIFRSLKHKPNIFLGVPALYGLLCLLKTAPLSCVDYFICGGDALPDKIRAFFGLVYGRKLCNGYGLTETSPLISVDFDDLAQPTSTVGAPVTGVTCVIKDDDGHDLPAGQIGQLWVKGDNIMMGYYNAPEKTKEVIKDGWFVTGDLAKFDAYGKLVICGRLKDIIIHKGMNIYPQEVENVILKHKDVLHVGVIGKDENFHGQVPIAFVKLRVDCKDIESKLRKLCKKELAAYKVPRKFLVIKEMPLTATGKVDKNSLRKQITD
ncbi:class I adenylate-forming enzyme family protein [Candidatus Dependentiae bacterium]